ncbi:MAG TPA: Rrf2 family transcriptional regulator, partial [Gammaproteobacteria bacterium]|nr:Rrf2 family transcriptional regulator [Gammaproteobacteria bacterium]
ISGCQGISMSYVEQIFSRLRRAGLVHGTPGPGGGYRLGRPPEQISVGEVIALMESGRGGQPHTSTLDHIVWSRLTQRIDAFLRGVTLADFVQRPQIRAALARQYAGGTWRCDVCGALATRRGCEGTPVAGVR